MTDSGLNDSLLFISKRGWSKVGNFILFYFSGRTYFTNIIDKLRLFAGLVFIERACFKTVPKPARALREGGGGEEREEGKKKNQTLKHCKVQYFARIDLKDQEHNSLLLKQPYDTKQVYP